MPVRVRARHLTIAFAAVISLLLIVGPGRAAATAFTDYTNVVFSDGFESGSLSAWDAGNGSTGTIALTSAAAHSGTSGARFTNAAGQFDVIVKTLSAPVQDSTVTFWVRVASGGGMQEVAEARDGTSSQQMWGLLYDGSQHGFYFYPRTATSSTEVFTGRDSALPDTWVKVSVQYTATAAGGAQIYINDQTQSTWGVSGDYTRTADLQRLQLWNDSTTTTDFDDVSIATPALAPPPATTVPGAPTSVQGVAGDRQVGLSWTAPAYDGNSPITGYRITPYIGATAQTPITTTTPATSQTIRGLTNGTAYTFTVAAINAVGTGADSNASPAVTPSLSAATVAGAPTGVQGVAGDGSVDLSWSAPSSDGRSDITGYRITPYVGTAAQTPIDTATTATSRTISGLANGTGYTFTVAALNGVGPGQDSAPSAVLTPTATQAQYSNIVFSDGFESGDLSAWDGVGGTSGSVSVTSAAAHVGASGARFSNVSGQSAVLLKKLAAPVQDSSVTFWIRVDSGVGIQTVAATRDAASSQTMWALLYDATRHGFYFYPYSGTGSTEIFTGNDSAPAGSWIKVEVQYTATATGGAQLYLNGETQSAWGVSGDYSRTADLQRLQLWNDAVATVDFDDVTVAMKPPPPATVPDAPTNVQGTPGDQQVDLTWTAPAFTGNRPLSGYQITPYLGDEALAPIVTSSTATSRTMTGLINGSGYTFKVAAINEVGTGPNSDPSASVTPSLSAATVPGAPTGAVAIAGDGSADVSWNAPASDGRSQISGYKITPYIGTSAQTSIVTSSPATNKTITGLTNGTAYTFTVAAINAVGTGAASDPSAAVTVGPSDSRYTNVAFSDGFEAGNLNAWDGTPGSTGSVTATSLAAHTGGSGVRFSNSAGQFGMLLKTLSSPLKDSSVGFWMRVGSGGGVETIAAARDQSSGETLWGLLYDANQHGLFFYPRKGTVATEIFTGANSVVPNQWVKVEIQYTATSTGGAQLYLNGKTNSAWGVTGDYTRTNNFQRLQLWDDAAITTDYDDVTIASPPPAGATAPDAPTAVQAGAGDAKASLSWSAPASDGGSPITSYRITPYVGSTAQTPIVTGTTATSRSITGLTNGTTYTFKVAAINGIGTGADSAASNAVTPTLGAASPPDAPTDVQAAPLDKSVDLTWSAPASTGGSTITSYRITPYVGNTAQTTVVTSTASTSQTVTGLTNGTTYTFTVAAVNSAGTGTASDPSDPVTPVAANLNAIQAENAQPGDPNWGDFNGDAPITALSGYGSRISVNHGQSIDFYVTTTAASVDIDVYRMGWYGGAGARLMRSMGSFPGVNQPQAQPDPTYLMVSENWTKTATLDVPSNWTTGVYLARLKASNGYGSLIPFVVRDDGGHEALLFQASTNTYQAYNAYGGTSLYTSNPAHKVSYDRPFLEGNGSGQFLRWEYPFIRWAEKQGYDLGYTTDIDTGANTSPLTNHKALLVVGHDEYWTKGMRDNVEGAIAAGVNVGFFAGNESYWQVRAEANAAGVPNRVLVSYKDGAACTCDGGPDPMFGVDNSQLTTLWRDPLVNRPEDAMMGVMFGGEVNNAAYTVQNASNWVYTGTGFTNGTKVPGIVGYEYDHYFGDSTTPANTTVLAATNVVNTENNQPDVANSTIYRSPSGAWVFAAGTIQWSWGLDNVGGAGFVNPGIQKMTSNILDAFTGAWVPPGT